MGKDEWNEKGEKRRKRFALKAVCGIILILGIWGFSTPSGISSTQRLTVI
jgi:hypothetical protein